MVPDPPEEYFLLKYGTGWETPQEAGGFEQEVLDLMANSDVPEETVGVMQLDNEYEADRHTGSLKVVDVEGQPVLGAEISLAATSVLTGLHQSSTNKDGFVYFSLPQKDGYVVAVQFGDVNEILYLENLAPNVDYVYRPDPDINVGRADALIPQNS
jgi:hypothetical protein